MIQQTINNNLKEFLKAGKSFEAGVLRLMIASFKNKEIENKGKGKEAALADEEIIEILKREAKKRKESINIYSQNNRSDLAQKESAELEVLKKYLPAELSKKEIEDIVDGVLKKFNPATQKDIGKIIKLVLTEAKGGADASMISEIVKKNLNE
ncbi:GatB/YqeY domain-containing protein [Candidatus Wolfebacteria bacterium]|nr:GatB/YqeY domain-containing protein [Candidatus Wolfebacteria bacterium]